MKLFTTKFQKRTGVNHNIFEIKSSVLILRSNLITKLGLEEKDIYFSVGPGNNEELLLYISTEENEDLYKGQRNNKTSNSRYVNISKMNRKAFKPHIGNYNPISSQNRDGINIVRLQKINSNTLTFNM